MRRFLDAALRVRALVYCVVGAALTALFVYLTARIVLSGAGWLDTLILAGLATGCGFQTRRWYRRYRRAASTAVPPARVIYERGRSV